MAELVELACTIPSRVVFGPGGGRAALEAFGPTASIGVATSWSPVEPNWPHLTIDFPGRTFSIDNQGDGFERVDGRSMRLGPDVPGDLRRASRMLAACANSGVEPTAAARLQVIAKRLEELAMARGSKP